MALHLYRIAQEALHNAVRHGNPSQLAVRLQQNGVGLILEVQDNGLGFDVEQPSADGMGLRFMHHRSRLIGGVLEITSKTGEGTLVRCRWSPGESME
jgi:signal transduction histidine kinase